MKPTDELRQIVDDLATRRHLGEDVLVKRANELLDSLDGERPGSGAAVVSNLPPPRYACDGATECALSDYSLKKCRHFGPHERGPDCGVFADTRCPNCPPPHGICKEVK